MRGDPVQPRAYRRSLSDLVQEEDGIQTAIRLPKEKLKKKEHCTFNRQKKGLRARRCEKEAVERLRVGPDVGGVVTFPIRRSLWGVRAIPNFSRNVKRGGPAGQRKKLLKGIKRDYRCSTSNPVQMSARFMGTALRSHHGESGKNSYEGESSDMNIPSSCARSIGGPLKNHTSSLDSIAEDF